MVEKLYRVGLVGATGLVGREILKTLEDRGFPVQALYLWASSKSAGETIHCFDQDWQVQELRADSFKNQDLDFVFFSGGGNVSAEYGELAAQAGAIVIDNSSHFRMDPNVPLVVPEVNPEALATRPRKGIIANPNCSTIQMMLPLQALHEAVGIERVIVSTYQSVSGAGAEAIEELRKQVGDLFSGKEVQKSKFPHQIAFNCLPQIDVFFENGMTKEEMKMILESRKIMGLPELKITATAVRVPVFIGHSESINVDLKEDCGLEEVREILSSFPGVEVWDDTGNSLYPTAFDVAGRDEVFVGRLRKDDTVSHGLHLWVVSDNLRKGAALNAVQIAELSKKREWI